MFIPSVSLWAWHLNQKQRLYLLLLWTKKKHFREHYWTFSEIYGTTTIDCVSFRSLNLIRSVVLSPLNSSTVDHDRVTHQNAMYLFMGVSFQKRRKMKQKVENIIWRFTVHTCKRRWTWRWPVTLIIIILTFRMTRWL